MRLLQNQQKAYRAARQAWVTPQQSLPFAGSAFCVLLAWGLLPKAGVQ